MARERAFGPPRQSGASKPLTDQQVNEIRFVTSGTQSEIAKKYGVSDGTIAAIWHNEGRFAKVPIDEKMRAAYEAEINPASAAQKPTTPANQNKK